MGGLVGNYMGAAVGKSMADIGTMMFKGREAEIDRAEKRAARIEDLDRQEVLRRDLAQQQADLRRELAAGRGESGGGSGGVSDIAEGSLIEEQIAARAGMSVPEFRKWRAANKTGDYSPFATDAAGPTDVSEDAEGFLSVNTKREYPPGFDQEVAAKRKLLGELFTEATQGKNYENTTKGRATQQQTDATAEAIADPSKAGLIGQGMAAGQGKPIVDVKDGTLVNQYTGKTATTAVGKATIGEKDANAKRDLAEIQKIDAEIAGGALSKNSRDRLTTMVNSANATIRSLQENGPRTTGLKPDQVKAAKEAWQRELDDATSLRNEATRLLRESLKDPGAKPPAPAPRAAGAGGGVVSSLLNTPPPTIGRTIKIENIKQVK